MCFVAAIAIISSCDKDSTQENGNKFVGTWVADTEYDFYINSYGRMCGSMHYTLVITDDNRCHLYGTNHITYTYSGISRGEEERSDDYHLMYDIETDKSIKVKGHTNTLEDGLYFDDGSLYLMKNEKTLTAAVCVQVKESNSQITQKGILDIDFIRQ